MEFTSAQILPALDAYMKENGGGTKYLATRLRRIFDNKTAPLNSTTGPLAILAQSTKDFTKKIDKISKSIDSTFTPFIANIGAMNNMVSKITKLFDSETKSFLENLEKNSEGKINGSVSDNSVVQNQQNELLMKSFDKLFREKPLPITIQNIDPQVIRTLEMFKNKEEVLPDKNKSLLSSFFNKKPQAANISLQNNNISNRGGDDNSSGKSSSILGSILKWGALLISGAFIIKLLNETPLGQKIKEFIKTSISGIFTWIGEKLTEPGTQTYLKSKIDTVLNGVGSLFSMVGSAFSSVVDAFMFIGKEFYDKVIFKIQEENEGLAKIASGATLKLIPKFFGKTTKFIGALITGAVKIFPKLAKVLKFIPGIGSVLSFAFAYDRIANKGDYVGGLLEIAAGIAYFVPGVGTAIGVGIDVLNTFLDYKQSQPDVPKGAGKGEVITGLIESATEWFIDKFGVERLYQIPVIGPLMKIVKGLTLLSTDPVEGMKTALKGIFAFNPLTQLSNAVSFIDFLMNGNVATDPNVTSSMSDWFNSDIWIDKIGGFIGGIVDVVTEKVGWIFGKVKSAMEWIFGEAESEMSEMDELKNNDPKAYRKRRLDEYRKSKDTSAPPSNLIPINDGRIDKQGITVVQPNSKDHHLFAKDGGPFDSFLKEMNANFDEKLSMLVALSNETINAILQGSGQVSQTIVATAGAKSGGGTAKSYGNGDPIRDQRNRANIAISR